MSNLDNYQQAEPAGTARVEEKGDTNASILKPYSVGYAAANLEVGQTTLEVFPAEIRSYTDGEVTDNLSAISTTGVDGNGNNYSNNVQVSNSIKAEWLSRNAWLKTPGLVRRGEDVMIWRMGDTDQYYWELLGTSNHLRRRDVLLLVISNTGDEQTKELTPSNSYFLEFNTVDKHITLITPNNDGEACGYTMQLNTKDGNFSFSDTVGNAIVMDSIAELIQMQNSSKSTVKLSKTNIEIFAQESINIKTKALSVETETTNMKGNSFSSDYPTTSMKGNDFTGTFPNTTWSGTGLSMQYANGTMNAGSMTIQGSSLDFNTSSLNHNGTNIGATHKHMEQGDGKPTGPPQ